MPIAFSPMVRGSPAFDEFEEVARDLAQLVQIHAPPVVGHGDHRAPTATAQDDADAASGQPRLRILVGGVGDELIQGVLGVLVRLPGD